ncbi:MAG: STAS domain-containing protein [Actinomycetota bacterium]|nr:STAS domain-containing protein [Actinomycetota bacterium]
MAEQLQFVVAGPILRSDIPALVRRLSAMVQRGDAATIVCQLRGVGASAASLEALARLQLVAGRHGCRLRLRGASKELRELVEFAGMQDVLAV